MMINMDEGSLRVRVFTQTTCQMVNLGFQARQRGYRYLREAVWVAYRDSAALEAITKRLYPAVAKRFDTSDKQVERAIRNAIETAWMQGEPETLRAFFGEIYGDGTIRPTNKEVIDRLVNFVKTDTV
ncbi:MAG: sporulation initiation factor Spo0A C-terminal domain-containing protein [Lachnospiraceae bacterium]|nr:sporulation initiation factor Spo0A C-terminal domain-containing protein [Lachnospiraceae bacterium]